MSEMNQVFIAPGAPELTLPGGVGSPWVYGRTVILPLWDWYAILREAEKRDDRAGVLLVDISGDYDGQDVSLLAADAGYVISFLDALVAVFDAGVDVRESQQRYELTEYSSYTYADMAAVVAAVLRESLRLGAPFRSWIQ